MQLISVGDKFFNADHVYTVEKDVQSGGQVKVFIRPTSGIDVPLCVGASEEVEEVLAKFAGVAPLGAEALQSLVNSLREVSTRRP